MAPDFETPFPFCESCATWHEPGGCEAYARGYWRRYDRITFLWGFSWGVGLSCIVAIIFRVLAIKAGL